MRTSPLFYYGKGVVDVLSTASDDIVFRLIVLFSYFFKYIVFKRHCVLPRKTLILGFWVLFDTLKKRIQGPFYMSTYLYTDLFFPHAGLHDLTPLRRSE